METARLKSTQARTENLLEDRERVHGQKVKDLEEQVSERVEGNSVGTIVLETVRVNYPYSFYDYRARHDACVYTPNRLRFAYSTHGHMHATSMHINTKYIQGPHKLSNGGDLWTTLADNMKLVAVVNKPCSTHAVVARRNG